MLIAASRAIDSRGHRQRTARLEARRRRTPAPETTFTVEFLPAGVAEALEFLGIGVLSGSVDYTFTGEGVRGVTVVSDFGDRSC